MTRSGDWLWLFVLLKLGQNMRDHETFILAKATCMASALHHSKSFYSVFFLYEGRGHLIILRFFQNFSRILSSLALRFSYFYIQCYDLYKKKTWDPWHSVKKKREEKLKKSTCYKHAVLRIQSYLLNSVCLCKHKTPGIAHALLYYNCNEF